MVRQGSVVSLGLGAVLALAALGSAPDGETKPAPLVSKDKAELKLATPASAVPIESRPYRIRAWLAIDPRARVDLRGREALVAGWKRMVARFVGAPWELEIAEGDGPLATNSLDGISPELVESESKGFDKSWLFRLEPHSDGLVFSGREFDAATGRIGLLCSETATIVADGPRALLQLGLSVFAPSAEIAESSSGNQKIRVQGAMLPAANSIGEVVSVGSVFRPTRIFYKADGKGIQLVTPIKKTYLRVESLQGGVANCAIISALGNPFTTKVVGKAKMVAVGLKPASIPTRLRFMLSVADGPAIPGTKPEPRPAAGYDVVAVPIPDGLPRPVGTTDREGRIVLEPGFSAGLVSLRLMAAGIEPLIQFPIMPGEQAEENLITNVDPKPATVTVESELNSLRDEIVDLIAVRHRLYAKIKSRGEAETPNWPEVKQLLEDFKTLPPSANYEGRLKRLEESLANQQKASNRRVVLTRTAKKLIEDTQALIDRYLDDEDFNSFGRAVADYEKQTRAGNAVSKSLPKAPAFPAAGSAATTEAGSGVTLAPPGSGFRAVMPGPPAEQNSMTPDGASEIRSFRFTDTANNTYLVEYWDYPVALTPELVTRVIDTERDRQGAAFPSSTLTRELPVSIDSQAGKEIEWETTAAGTPPSGFVCRIVTVGSRVFVIGFGGAKASLKGKPALDFLNSFHVIGRGNSPSPATAPASSAAATPKASEPQKSAPAATPKARPKPNSNANPF